MQSGMIGLGRMGMNMALRLLRGRHNLLLQSYASGSDGPAQAAGLLQKDGRAWRPL